MNIRVIYKPSKTYVPVVWYRDDGATITRVSQWRDFFLFGKEFSNEED